MVSDHKCKNSVIDDFLVSNFFIRVWGLKAPKRRIHVPNARGLRNISDLARFLKNLSIEVHINLSWQSIKNFLL